MALTWYYSPVVQVVFLGFVCFCCPGCFNSLSGLGAGGSMSSNVALTDSANAALYACFCIVGFFAGSIVNKVGIRPCFTISSLGYALYSASLWVYDRKQVGGFVIAAGAILGCCAAIFWSAQGAMMMSLPKENEKGKFVSIFWSLFNLGGILGSVITLGLNLENAEAGGVSTNSYIAFVVIMLVGSVLSLGMADLAKVVRSDGSRVDVVKNTSWKVELQGSLEIWRDWRMVLLFPAFFASNFFYSYQFRVNAVYYDASTRALNDTMYWGMQIFASLAIGYFLDYQGLSRRARALMALGVMALILLAVWIGAFVFQLTFDNNFDQPIHWTSPGFGGPFVLYMLFGFSDALYQTYIYWVMGSMSNSTEVLARYAGFYKALQSAGAAVSFGIDAVNIPLKWECLVSWLLVMVSFPLMAMVANKVPETAVEPELPRDKHTLKDSAVYQEEKHLAY
ncbi:MFS general substrate transporter [Hesseltinella vesiculosa]|uniref:MFS general substrate transporter n=1 Tax=Hesseltinella vesiculosa TaxID=101127 RepID=A0A1X2GNY0_9FUNG|nr:MFS general substrate transporter [Hesseltinella vesiculosa]